MNYTWTSSGSPMATMTINWETEETEYDLDELCCIFQQMYAYTQGWADKVEPFIKKGE